VDPDRNPAPPELDRLTRCACAFCLITLTLGIIMIMLLGA
jgi:hypothetical protein